MINVGQCSVFDNKFCICLHFIVFLFHCFLANSYDNTPLVCNVLFLGFAESFCSVFLLFVTLTLMIELLMKSIGCMIYTNSTTKEYYFQPSYCLYTIRKVSHTY